MVKMRVLVPAEDVDLSTVKYEPEAIQGQPTYSNSISFTGLLSFFIYVCKNSIFVVRALITCSLKTTTTKKNYDVCCSTAFDGVGVQAVC